MAASAVVGAATFPKARASSGFGGGPNGGPNGPAGGSRTYRGSAGGVGQAATARGRGSAGGILGGGGAVLAAAYPVGDGSSGPLGPSAFVPTHHQGYAKAMHYGQMTGGQQLHRGGYSPQQPTGALMVPHPAAYGTSAMSAGGAPHLSHHPEAAAPPYYNQSAGGSFGGGFGQQQQQQRGPPSGDASGSGAGQQEHWEAHRNSGSSRASATQGTPPRGAQMEQNPHSLEQYFRRYEWYEFPSTPQLASFSFNSCFFPLPQKLPEILNATYV